MTQYTLEIRFNQGEKAVRFTTKAVSESAARRNANQLLNKLGRRAASIEVI